MLISDWFFFSDLFHFYEPAIYTLSLFLNKISISKKFYENNKRVICHHETNTMVIGTKKRNNTLLPDCYYFLFVYFHKPATNHLFFGAFSLYFYYNKTPCREFRKLYSKRYPIVCFFLKMCFYHSLNNEILKSILL